MRGGNSRPTIIDVARVAGVTRSVVSRVFTGNGAVSARARDLVLAAAAQLGYQPNIAARTLVTGRSNTIGALVRRVTDPAYAKLIVGMQQRATAYNYRILTVTGNLDTASERAGLETLLSLQVDGLLIGSGRLSNKAILEVARRAPTVVLWREVPGVDAVRADESETTDALFRHLTDLGHRRVGFLSARTQYNHNAVSKTRSVRDTAARFEAQLAVETAGYDFDECRAATLRLMRREPAVTAIIGLSGWAAVGAMTALQDLGLQIPADVSVACLNAPVFDEIPQLGLTAVHQSPEDAAGLAVDLVIGRLAQPGGPAHRRLIKGTFVPGTSTGPAAHR